jgi:hypothetical protein
VAAKAAAGGGLPRPGGMLVLAAAVGVGAARPVSNIDVECVDSDKEESKEVPTLGKFANLKRDHLS